MQYVERWGVFPLSIRTGPVGPAFRKTRLNLENLEPRIMLSAGSITDTVFSDLNANGTQDDNESGLSGVTVDLYRDNDGNGQVDVTDTFLASAVTDVDGQFVFSNLDAGDYVVEVSETDAALQGYVANPDQAQYAADDDVAQAIERLWTNRKPYLISQMNTRLAADDTYVLYDTQVYTDNLIRYAAATGNIEMLDGLAELYLEAYAYMSSETEYVYFYWPGYSRESVHDLDESGQDPSSAMMWTDDPSETENGEVGVEYPLYVSQFLHGLTSLINAVLDMDSGDRTSNMTSLVTTYASVVVNDIYARWLFADQGIFQVKCWGGESGLFNHEEFLEKKLERYFGSTLQDPVSYLNAVTDTDMWIVTGVLQMLAAHEKDPTLVPVSSALEADMRGYLDTALQLIADRLTESELTDFNGNPVTGLNFDLGAWDDHPDHAYTGYDGATSPLGEDEMPAVNAGWDISHARRFVMVFDSLYRYRDVVDSPFPSDDILRGLANQLLYGAFNKDLDAPLFTNFMDGTNGWYRVGYHSETDPGQEPYYLTAAFITGGYGYWTEFNTDMTAVQQAMWDAMNRLYLEDSSGNGRSVIPNGAVWASDGDSNGAPTGHMTFDGADDYIDLGGDQDLVSETGAIEFWINPDQSSRQEDLVNLFENSYYDFLLIRRLSDDRILVHIEDGDSVMLSVASTATITVGEWNHVAVTQDGNGVKVFINGQESSVTGTNSSYWTQHLVNITGAWIGKGHWSKFDGAMDSVRIYDRAIVGDEIARHAAWDNVVAAWTFDDDEEQYYVFNATLTENGLFGGAVEFDGTDDYFRAYVDQDMASEYGTIELWFKPDSASDVDDLLSIHETTYQDYLLLRRMSNNTIYVRIEDDDVGLVNLYTTDTITVGEWNHIAVTQDGGGVKIYINGEEASYNGNSVNSSAWMDHLTITGAYIGTSKWNYYSDGMMDELGVYDRALTESEIAGRAAIDSQVAEWTSDNGTTDSDYYVFNAAFTSDGKVGQGLAFDGTDDYFRATPSQDYASSEGTIELWFRPDQASKVDDLVSIHENTYYDYLRVRRHGDNTIQVTIEDDDSVILNVYTVDTITVGEWNHIAVTQNGTGVAIYINGEEAELTGGSENSSAWTGHLTVSTVYVAKSQWGYNLDGTLDEIRIYDRALSDPEIQRHMAEDSAIGVWEFNTEPDSDTVAFFEAYYGTNYNTTYSLGMMEFLPTFMTSSAVAGYTLTTDEQETGSGLSLLPRGIVEEAPAPDSFYVLNADWTLDGRFNGGMEFDGADDYFRAAPSQDYASSEGTIELWFRPDQASKVDDLVSIHQNTYYDYLRVRRLSNNTIQVTIEDDDSVILNAYTVDTITVGEWNHVAVTQDGTGVAIYINGEEAELTGGSVNSGAWTGHLTVSTVYVGKSQWGYNLDGVMDELRIHDAALSATDILLHNNGVYAGDSNLVRRWRFDVQPDHATAAWNATQTDDGVFGGAVEFDGTDDYFRPTATQDLASSTGAVDLWFKPDTANDVDDLVSIHENTYYDYLLIRRMGDNTIWVIIEDNDTAVVNVRTTDTIRLGQWNHIAVTQDGGGVAIYINGEEAGIAAGGTNSAAWTDHLTVNYLYVGNSQWNHYTDGAMDEIRFHDAALSAAEVAQHANRLYVGDSDVVMRYGFDVAEDSTESDTTSYSEDGQRGGAAVFDGTDDYLDLSHDSAYATEMGAVDFWVKPDEASREEDLFHLYEDSSESLLIRRLGNGTINVIIRGSGANVVNVTTSSALAIGEWNHVVVMQDGEGVRVFIDGEDASATGTNSGGYWTGHLTLNNMWVGRNNDGSHDFKGAMDRIRIYDRVLGENEITLHSRDVYNDWDGVLGEWTFDFQPGIYA